MGKEELKQVLSDLDLSIETDFVPWSKSRNAKEDYRSLNWRVHLKRSGQVFCTVDFMKGVAYCPSYSKYKKGTLTYEENILYETEYGYSHVAGHRPILPDILDVMECLVIDSDTLNYGTFEEWARELGMDEDSRRAEGIYRTCLETTLKLRAAVGEHGLSMLRAAVQDC